MSNFVRTLFVVMLLGLSMNTLPENPADEMVPLDVDSLPGKSFDVVWAIGSPVERGQVSLNFSENESNERSFSMSGNCDYSGTYSTGPASPMDLTMNGTMSNCDASPNVKDAIDHWNTNREINGAKMNIMYCSAFGSSWVTLGDKIQGSNEMMLMVGQHVLDHPKFLNSHYEIQQQTQTP